MLIKHPTRCWYCGKIFQKGQAHLERRRRQWGCHCFKCHEIKKKVKHMNNNFDPVCLIHGLKHSEHHCLSCCLCFKSLTIDKCSVNEQGQKQDVCMDCYKLEQEYDKRTP